jgi:Ser/Thr protein kinase RdoA (MazF antagonist)
MIAALADWAPPSSDAGDFSSAPVQAFDDRELQVLDVVVRAALERWGLPEVSDIRLVNVSENATFFVDPPSGEELVLRVGRRDYNTLAEVTSELVWMAALGAPGEILTPQIVATVDGAMAGEIVVSELPGTRPCAMFGRVPGESPDESGELVPLFRMLGAVAGKLHAHSRNWTPPSGFTRRQWTYATTIGDKPSWGRWERGPNVTMTERELLTRVCVEIERQLVSYGTAADRHGLVHSDLRPGNILLDGEDLWVIDFDDSGYSWWLWDLATGLTFLEHRPDMPELVASWLQGYRAVSPLSEEVAAIAPTLIMLRRMQVLAWLGSHASSELALQEGPAYLVNTCELAERYLVQDGFGAHG